MKSNSFELAFVHLDDLIFHETCDFNRVCRLADQIKRDGHLKNPVLVANISDASEGLIDGESDASPSAESGKLLVLDGVDRVSALKLLSFPDVLVQKVDYMDESVELTSWDHLIFKIEREQLVEKLKKLDLEISPCEWNWRREALEDLRTVCYLLFRNQSGLVLSQRDSSVESRVRNLFSIVAIYRTSWEIYHPGSVVDLPSAFNSFENCTAISTFPAFKKEQVLDLVSRGILFPFGVTRFVIPQWVLGLEVSSSVLGANVPLSEKNLFLRELLSYRIKSKKAKFYQESVILFNE
jgi:hypothetical protein